MIYLILLFCGFIIHVVRDYDRKRTTDYLKKNDLKILSSLILSCCLFAIVRVDYELNGITSLALGYSGDSFFRYLIDKKFPDVRF